MAAVHDHSRFERWLTDYAGILHHITNGFAERTDRADLLQEVMLALWTAAPAYRSEARESTFVYRVAYNTALMWKRAGKNYRKKVEVFGNDPSLGPPAPPDDAAGNREKLEWLYAQIRRLAPLDRSLLMLYLDGRSYREIGEVHDLSETNVGARLSRLKDQLTKAMGGLKDELR